MEKQERVKAILGISLLYIIVTSIFSFINKVCTFMFSQNDFSVKIRSFLQSYALWIVVVVAVIIILSLWLKKLNQGIHFNLLDDLFIRTATGALLIVGGIVSLAGTLPIYATSIQAAIQTSRMIQTDGQRILREVIVSDVISVLAFLCQVFLGIYLIKSHKEKTV